MQFNAVSLCCRRRDPFEKLAIVVWVVFLLAICVRVLVWPRVHSVYPAFAAAALNWQAGVDLHRPVSWFHQYRYSPLVAALLVPFGILPDRLGGVLWRLLNAGIYLAALAWWSRAVLPRPLHESRRALLFLLVAPLSIANVNNGQSNPLLLGLLLAATAAAATDRWNLASGCVALASLFKLYPIAIGLLLAALYPRRFAGRLAVALALGLALPFFLQRPDYVMAQYAAWGHLLVAEPRYGQMELLYSDLRLLWRAWLAPLGSGSYVAAQLGAAAGITLLCMAGHRAGWSRRHLLTLLFGLACCWMTLFGLSTESATYILLAPALAWALLEAWLEPEPLTIRATLLCSYALLAATQIAGWFPGMAQRVGALGPQPLAALLLFSCLLFQSIRLLWQPAVAHGAGASSAERPGMTDP